MANFERNYGYNVTTSYHPGSQLESGHVLLAPSVELDVYRVSTKTTEDGKSYLDKTNVARLNAPTTEKSNLYSGSHGVSAVEAHLALKDFAANYPEAAPDNRLYHGYLLKNDVKAEIAIAEKEAYAIEARRTEVALAVAGMDLATADEMASIEAAQLAEEQTAPAQQ